MSELIIYSSADNQIQIEVILENDSVWLSQSQISTLFGRDRSVITKHINNVFKEGELEKGSNVQKMHVANSDKPVEFYNLDVIISVGYRVKSVRGTQFRQWATQRLKDYLVRGYTINQKRLDQLQKTISLISQNRETENIQLSEAKGLLEIIQNYAQSFVLLNQYDSNDIKLNNLNDNFTYELEYESAMSAILELKRKLIDKREATQLFGNPKDESFKGILGNIVQSFDGHYLYPSIEQQAANLLYLIIKNHPFTDGNKRIGAFMFIWFLENNKYRFKKNGELKINDNALTALALLVAQCDPSEKELMISLICNLIADS